jgi:hypothetical protein
VYFVFFNAIFILVNLLFGCIKKIEYKINVKRLRKVEKNCNLDHREKNSIEGDLIFKIKFKMPYDDTQWFQV